MRGQGRGEGGQGKRECEMSVWVKPYETVCCVRMHVCIILYSNTIYIYIYYIYIYIYIYIKLYMCVCVCVFVCVCV